MNNPDCLIVIEFTISKSASGYIFEPLRSTGIDKLALALGLNPKIKTEPPGLPYIVLNIP